MKKLSKKDKHSLDEMLKATGKALIGTMNLLEIPNYLKTTYVTDNDEVYFLTIRKEKIEKTSDKMLLDLGFKQIKNTHDFFHIELDAKGFIVSWLEELKGYFIEPNFRPTARIEVSDKMALQDTFKLITGKNIGSFDFE